MFSAGAGVFFAGAGAGAGGEKPGVCTALPCILGNKDLRIVIGYPSRRVTNSNA